MIIGLIVVSILFFGFASYFTVNLFACWKSYNPDSAFRVAVAGPLSVLSLTFVAVLASKVIN